MLLGIGIVFFYLAGLINYETKDYKENHLISPSYITRRKVSYNASIFSNRRDIQESYVPISS